MTYNESIKAFNRWRADLEQVVERIKSDGSATMRSVEPQTYAYRLREAMKAAKKHEVEPFMHFDISFRVQGQYVIASFKSQPRALFIDENESITDVQSFPEAITQFDVVATLSKVLKPGILFKFPNFNGADNLLRNWAATKNVEIQLDPLRIEQKES